MVSGGFFGEPVLLDGVLLGQAREGVSRERTRDEGFFANNKLVLVRLPLCS